MLQFSWLSDVVIDFVFALSGLPQTSDNHNILFLWKKKNNYNKTVISTFLSVVNIYIELEFINQMAFEMKITEIKIFTFSCKAVESAMQ